MENYFKKLDYKLLEKKEVYRGRRVVVQELTYYNNRDNKKVYREHVLAGDAAIVLAINENDEDIMIQEPRTPIGKIILSLPAGMIEPGEKPEDAAIRELEEETGYRAQSIRLLRYEYPSIGYSNERSLIFLAHDLKKTQRNLDATEDIKVVTVPLKDLKKMLDSNEILDASTTIALLHYFLYINHSYNSKMMQ